MPTGAHDFAAQYEKGFTDDNFPLLQFIRHFVQWKALSDDNDLLLAIFFSRGDKKMPYPRWQEQNDREEEAANNKD